MSNGIKFLETVFDRLGPRKNAAEFPGARDEGRIKNLRNFLRFCEKGIGYNEGFGDGDVRSRFSNIENLPDEVKKVYNRIDDRLRTEHKEKAKATGSSAMNSKIKPEGDDRESGTDHKPFLTEDDPNLIDEDMADKSELPFGFNKGEAMNKFQALFNELNRMDFNSGEFEGKLDNFLELLRSDFFNTEEGIKFAQQYYEKMSSGIKFLEKALDQLGLKEGAKNFPNGENMAKDVRNLLRLCEKCITEDEWYNSFREPYTGIQSRFWNIENLPDDVDKIFKRICSRLECWE
jgi:hypothetical protein